MKNKVLILMDNHFDLTWRRCFDRPTFWKGSTFVSYAEIEDYYITDHLAYADTVPGYRFQIESTAVIRKYLERHPAKKDIIRRRLQDGTIYIPFSGDNIVDSNMTSGETILRNYLLGKLWLESELGFSPDICTRNDAFGNCGQLPQIVRGCEGEWITSISYCLLDEDEWEGLDGSRLKQLRLHNCGHGGGFYKYPPCKTCHGDPEKRKTCSACGGRGIDFEYVKNARFPFRIDDPELLEKNGWAVLPYGGEEILPNEDVFNWVDAHKDEYDISFGTMPMIRDLTKHPKNPTVHRGDLNPSSSGTFVARIKTKQRLREAEYKMLNAETLSVMAAAHGGKLSKNVSGKVWEKIFFAAFHDSVTGTHTDPCYDELMDVFGEIDAGTNTLAADALSVLTENANGMISVINPTGDAVSGLVSVPCTSPIALKAENGTVLSPACVKDGTAAFAVTEMQPFEVRRFAVMDTARQGISRTEYCTGSADASGMIVLRSDEELNEAFGEAKYHAVIENNRFRVSADDFGLTEIYDKKLKKALSAAAGYRPCEWILEHDEGSPWTTFSDDRRRFRLAPYTRLLDKEEGEGCARLRFRTTPPMAFGYGIDGIDIITTVTLYDGIDRIEFADDAKWDTINHRLRAAFPVTAKGDTLYEVPYGWMKREPYWKPHEEENYTIGWNAATGDWAAINWAGVSAKEGSIALLNKGIPSYIIEDDTIFLSVLRSPGVPICLHEGRSYTMLDIDGMRDSGMHHHEFALTAYNRSLPESSIVADANSYEAGLLAVEGSVKNTDMPAVFGDGVRISSVKLPEIGTGMVIRLVETAGKTETVRVKFPAWVTEVYETNMMERKEQSLSLENGESELTFTPFKIRTLLCR